MSSESAEPATPPVTDEVIERAVHRAVDTIAARDREEQERTRAEEDREARITSEVSIAALLLTMLLSFLGFLRSTTDGAASDLRSKAAKAAADASAEWTLYQARSAQRSDLLVAQEALAREVMDLPRADARVRLARFEYDDYGDRMRRIDDQNQQAFFHIQDLVRTQNRSLVHAAQLDRKTGRYDMGVRTLTLALVLISVTLLAKREYLYWIGLGVAACGAALAVNGYFLLFG